MLQGSDIAPGAPTLCAGALTRGAPLADCGDTLVGMVDRIGVPSRCPQSGRLPLFAALIIAATAACGGGSANGGETGSADASASGSSSTSAANDGSTTNASAAPTDGSDGGGPPELGICADLLECVMAATPEVIAGTIATYGEEGSCWSLPGVTEENCWTECQALLETLRDAFPDLAECWECQGDEDCPEASSCYPVDHVCVPWECQGPEDCPAEEPYCLIPTHTCQPWECATDEDCPAEEPHCSRFDNFCFAEDTVHCGDPELCYEEPLDGTLKPCATMYDPGPCPTRGAVAYCTDTSVGADVTYYSLQAFGGAEEHCGLLNGTFTLA